MKKENIEFETLHSNKYRVHFLIGFVCVVVLLVIFIVGRSHAKYRVTQSIPLVNGTINYTLADLNVVAIYINQDSGYAEIDTIPDGYELNTDETYCTVNGEEDTSISISYDADTQTLNVSPMTSKGTKCYLYFDEQVSAGNIILANKTIDDSRSGEITGPLTEDTTGTVYSVEDDYGTSYVYAGAPTDNWVRFAGFYWRIIRINGDGSIRMIYNGTTTDQTGEGTQLQTSAYNTNQDDNAYVGYMYGSRGASSYSATHANTNNSTIKGVLDTWYQNNIVANNYDQYISAEQGFCNDRRIAISSETWWNYDTKRGYGTNTTVYAPFSRFLNTSGRYNSTQEPTLKCSQSNDYFTTSGSSRGNHELIYPIGLITSDEVVLAGGFGGSSNQSYYLYTNQYYWTMSPYYYDGAAWVFYVSSSGILNGVDNADGVRPVINLKADVSLTGTGTASDPYRVVGA